MRLAGKSLLGCLLLRAGCYLQGPAGSAASACHAISPSLDVTSLERTVDPCVDFQKFSCAGWIRNNPIPADQASWSVYAKLGDANQQFLWGILMEDVKAANRTPVQQKVGDYFQPAWQLRRSMHAACSRCKFKKYYRKKRFKTV